ncbi:MAG TPA: hypothetical protein VFL47_14375 [Flavisolibacter sp.]|nr:hypothetical protein [Flavisolibacter sp.]
MDDTKHVPLKREVEKVYGKKVVAYSDCLTLSKEISNRTGFQLNVNTLRRFFGLVKASYLPSLTTLDILSRFCGFKSFEQFESFSLSPVEEDLNSPLLQYIDTLFQKASLTSANDPVWTGIVHETILFLEKYLPLLDAFQRSAAKSLVGQTIYFEQFVNIDQLNGYYGNGLRHYLNEKKTSEAQVFAHALLTLRFFLTNERLGLEHHYHEMMCHSVNGQMHPLISARYFAAQLFFAQHQPADVYRVMTAARSFFKALVVARERRQAFPYFELVMTDALILVRQPLEALYYLREARKKKGESVSLASDVQLPFLFTLYEAAADVMIGEVDNAKRMFRKIKPQDASFLTRRYNNILYLLVERNLLPAKAKSSLTQLDDLLQLTGFQKLAFLFSGENAVNKKEQVKGFL